ncbi:hypothetical protein AB0J52_28420 [Spirillospora sp. NPDC049652]
MVASVSPIARPRGRRTAFTPRPAPLPRLGAPRPRAAGLGDLDLREAGAPTAWCPPVRPTAQGRVRQAVRRVRIGHALAAAGLALLPWIAVLAARMPSSAHVTNWSAAWIGLDAMLAACLVATGVLALRRDARLALPAAATAALLAMDAWFDVLTAAPGADRAVATVLAAGVELPLAVLCAVLAFRAFPKSAAEHG